MAKRLVALILVLLLSIESFAAVVSDNDGSAFITKAEFDSLKNNFQSQIDQYNTSIDSKIDGAIAGYLSGIRVAKESPYQLDASCGYSFPLVAFYSSTKDLWNDASSRYYALSVPKLIYRDIGTSISRFDSGRAINADADLWVVDGDYGPYNIPTNHLGTSAQWMGIRSGWHDTTTNYPGRDGNIYRIDKNESLSRVIGGNSHSVWTLRDCLYGQDNLYYVTGDFNSPWDGKNQTLQYWLDFHFLGYYTNQPWLNWPRDGVWNTNIALENDTWTESFLRQSQLHYRVVAGLKPESSHYTTQWTSQADAKTAYASIVTDVTIDTVSPWAGNFLSSPWTRVLDIKNSGNNKMIFGGDANIPSYNDYGFSYGPMKRASNDTGTKVTFSKRYFRFRDKQAFWNFGTSELLAGNYQNLKYISFPEWRATEKDSFQQDTSNRFSMIRASLVCYYDKNNKAHFMDEGMFLGTYDDDCTVEFSLIFNSTEASEIYLGLSKKPWDINHQSSNIPAWSYKIGSTETNVPAGSGRPTVPTNTVIQVKVPDVLKGEELYMIWNPPGKQYVELTSFDDYYITTEG